MEQGGAGGSTHRVDCSDFNHPSAGVPHLQRIVGTLVVGRRKEVAMVGKVVSGVISKLGRLVAFEDPNALGYSSWRSNYKKARSTYFL